MGNTQPLGFDPAQPLASDAAHPLLIDAVLLLRPMMLRHTYIIHQNAKEMKKFIEKITMKDMEIELRSEEVRTA